MLIGELGARTGIAPPTIRFYERVGVLPRAARTRGGYRAYEEGTLEDLEFVRAGQAIGLTLHEIAEIVAVRDRGEKPCLELVALMEQRLTEINQRLADLERMRRALATLVTRARSRDHSECPPAAVYEIIKPRPIDPSVA
jgi:DNA-binding transcriptional MerR regulator